MDPAEVYTEEGGCNRYWTEALPLMGKLPAVPVAT